jgi:hypothetical protein
MPKVVKLPEASALTLPLARGGCVRLTPFRDSPSVALSLHGPAGGDRGGVLLSRASASLLGSWLVQMAEDAGTPAAFTRPLEPPPARDPLPPGSLLTPGVDRDAVLASFARLAVPTFADWCTIDVVENDRPVRRLVVAHADTSKVKAARVLARYPHDPTLPHPRSEVWRTGRPEVAPDVPDARLRLAARSRIHLDILRSLRCRSSVAVPVMDRARIIGVMTFASAESTRRYDEEDVPLALTLARCAGLAAESIHLYREAHEALRTRLDARPPRGRGSKSS